MEFILICIVVGIFICVIKYIKNNCYDENKYEADASRIIMNLHLAESFSKDSYWEKYVGPTSVVVWYDADMSRRCKSSMYKCVIHFLVYEKDVTLIRDLSKDKDIADIFALKPENNIWKYEYELSLFDGFNRTLTKKIYNKITEEFPNAKCELTGADSHVIHIDFV